ncbi:NAD(P)-dependent oxidoreductase [Nocardioides daejeonensis]|uniref:NAD(P)-dependent oxidoreductase n=1 Tax=Nocardioides daejeonensis TaxID=1046556 RepID=UPI001950E2BF|nr:NAD(P)-dependent oxidoreductase [Nocardioides daejeonensis]
MPDQALIDEVGPVDGVEFLLASEVVDRADEVEVLVAGYVTNTSVADDLDRFPRLRLLQLQSAGYDGIPALLPSGVQLANAGGVHDDATAEMALGLTIAALRGIPESVRQQGTWRRMPGRRSLADSEVLIYGYGSIGRAIAERMLACKARVTAVASRARTDDLLGRVHGPESLPELLPRQHVVVVVLPLTEETRHVVNADLLATLSDQALVVNVGRGPLLDTDAALAEEGRIRFALDVTEPEPLPDGHPLWDMSGVLITPHLGGGTTAMLPRMADLVRANLRALVAGSPLRNVVA